MQGHVTLRTLRLKSLLICKITCRYGRATMAASMLQISFKRSWASERLRQVQETVQQRSCLLLEVSPFDRSNKSFVFNIE